MHTDQPVHRMDVGGHDTVRPETARRIGDGDGDGFGVDIRADLFDAALRGRWSHLDFEWVG